MTQVATKRSERVSVDGTSQGIALINRLEVDGVLTAHQAELLRKVWPSCDEDLAANPYLGTVREHARAYLGIPPRNRV
ncbi:MAG TPA: hypothetical protein VGP17_06520 [Solirubrobacteraceae bacterium]|jgi:hypothetical protein|nr:hypothetical protein [Solirubrobacteraceae bacterium]